jgi:3-isopropylmalate/(R)-2-methylmalate dehydratase large subunit
VPHTARTIIDKIWDAHAITTREDGQSLLWVDRHLLHEGSFLAFDQLAARDARVARPDLTFGVADHYVPTRNRDAIVPEIRGMVEQLVENCAGHGITLFGLDDRRQGIVHVTMPAQGLTLPGLIVVCGDSHTSTHGALGAYAFGIGASEVAHVMMTQTIWQKRPRRMRISVDGALPLVELVVVGDAEIAGVLGERGDLLGALRIGIGL